MGMRTSLNLKNPFSRVFRLAGGKGRRTRMGMRTSLNLKNPFSRVFRLAGGKGFEPLLTDPESAVLPLDEPPTAIQILPLPNIPVQFFLDQGIKILW